METDLRRAISSAEDEAEKCLTTSRPFCIIWNQIFTCFLILASQVRLRIGPPGGARGHVGAFEPESPMKQSQVSSVSRPRDGFEATTSPRAQRTARPTEFSRSVAAAPADIRPFILLLPLLLGLLLALILPGA